MILSFINFKGGVGKSTLSQNVAVTLSLSGQSVVLIDCDDTNSTVRWGEVRKTNDIKVVHHSNPKTVTKFIRSLKNKFDFVVVDCPPAINPITTRVLLVSDINLIPVLASGADVWTLEKFLSHIETVREKTKMFVNAKLVINRQDPRVKLHNDFKTVILQYVDAYQIGICKTIIRNRAAYAYANADGEGVLEGGNKTAADEITRFTNEIIL